MLTDDTAYNNYLTRITGVSYLDTILKWSRLNRGLTGVALDMQQTFRADNIAAKLSDSLGADLARIFSRPIVR